MMSVFAIMVKKPGQWIQHLDSNDWKSYFGATWNAGEQRWQGSNGWGIEVIGTWSDGFRPTKVRVHWDPQPATTTLQILDSNSNYIVNYAGYVDNQEVDITYAGYDIDILFVTGAAAYIWNIEFYVP